MTERAKQYVHFHCWMGLSAHTRRKIICALVERIYLIIVSREGNHAWFELLSKIFESFNVMACIPPPVCLWHAKKGIIYAWIMHCWIVNHWIVYRDYNPFLKERDDFSKYVKFLINYWDQKLENCYLNTEQKIKKSLILDLITTFGSAVCCILCKICVLY